MASITRGPSPVDRRSRRASRPRPGAARWHLPAVSILRPDCWHHAFDLDAPARAAPHVHVTRLRTIRRRCTRASMRSWLVQFGDVEGRPARRLRQHDGDLEARPLGVDPFGLVCTEDAEHLVAAHNRHAQGGRYGSSPVPDRRRMLIEARRRFSPLLFDEADSRPSASRARGWTRGVEAFGGEQLHLAGADRWRTSPRCRGDRRRAVQAHPRIVPP